MTGSGGPPAAAEVSVLSLSTNKRPLVNALEVSRRTIRVRVLDMQFPDSISAPRPYDLHQPNKRGYLIPPRSKTPTQKSRGPSKSESQKANPARFVFMVLLLVFCVFLFASGYCCSHAVYPV